ncbi:hypothetical protein EXIGLDRAFT_749355 [Exidia glandulosa HHB12029]|uniref:Uncharacterized protein n=1 Tax=Exidia glandulosa HHB12029 TaxID=1314781 RepID=A0A165I7I0_EXIGL|nr:hypothetical protein EXIGLDRAFT_749355 [Exidia glandulosa HHB12029]
MAHKLADELLKEILTVPLLVPDELFADTGPISPFSKAAYSAADVLLVCKRWMRVATPALYHTVVIRSTAQANALAAALKRNPDFGMYIKKLRLEGAYGDRLKILATTSPDISDFCMSLAIWADSGITGLTKVMSAINPRRVVLTTAIPYHEKFGNKKHTEVFNKLCSCIQSWTNLETFYLSGSSAVTSPELLRHSTLAEALTKSTSLRSVHIWLDRWPGFPAWDTTRRRFLETLASNHSISRFYVHAVQSYGYFIDALSSEIPDFMDSRVVVMDSTVPVVSAPTDMTAGDLAHNPFYIPMANAPEATRRDIWSHILDFAVAPRTIAGIKQHDWAWYDGGYFDVATAKSLMLTSHAFAATVIPLLCRHLAPQTDTAVATVLQYMEAYNVPGSTVQSFSSFQHPETIRLIRSLTQLRVCAVPSSNTILASVGRTSGATLQRLTLKSNSLPTDRATTASLYSFTALTTLCSEYGSTHSIARAKDLPPDAALANLRTVKLRDTSALNVLEPFSLPNLAHVICEWTSFSEGDCFLPRHKWKEGRKYIRPGVLTDAAKYIIAPGPAVRFDTSLPYGRRKPIDRFLARHGSKLRTLKVASTAGIDLACCSSLQTLEICEIWGKSLNVPFPDGHPVLRQLKLHWYLDLGCARSERPHWIVLFQRLTRTLFPSLQEVHLLYDPGEKEAGIWPATERDIKKSLWPKNAETLAAQGITLFDHTGRSWRPRLVAPSRR